MAVQYKDYYDILGLKRDAKSEEIKKAYRRLARKYHPDVNPGNQAAEDKFKEVQEAYAALGDPAKRKKYDQLGSGWQSGADFTPPPGWENVRVEFGDLGDMFGERSGFGGFSDFFETLFGGFGAQARPGRGRRSGGFARKGSDIESQISLTLEEVHSGTQPKLRIQVTEPCDQCGGRGIVGAGRCPRCHGAGKIQRPKTLTVKIAPGAREGSVIRIAGKGETGASGGPAGDLFLRVHLKPHPIFSPVGNSDLQVEVPVTPWEAALGSKVRVPTLDGPVEMTIPAGTQGGSRLRLRGQGLNKRGGERGDLFVRIKVVVPAELTAKERELFEQLAKVSRFNPR